MRVVRSKLDAVGDLNGFYRVGIGGHEPNHSKLCMDIIDQASKTN